MQPRINMIMTAAENVPALRRFYEQGLGWTAWGPASDMSVLYKVGTSILVFLNADYQARESGLPKADGVKSIWAIFVESKEAVDRVFQKAIDAGATVASILAISPTRKVMAGKSYGARTCRSVPMAA